MTFIWRPLQWVKIDGTSVCVATVLKIVKRGITDSSNWSFVKITNPICVLIHMSNAYNTSSPRQNSIQDNDLCCHTAPTVTDELMEQFFRRFRVPRRLHSDQGRVFEPDLIAHLCKLLHFHKMYTVQFNPKFDSLAERDNRRVKQILTTMANESRDDWNDRFPYITMACRALFHEVTKCTPHLLMLNHETNLPINLMIIKLLYVLEKMWNWSVNYEHILVCAK